MPGSLPVGKLPPDLMARILARAPCEDPRVLQGPGVGLDCAVVEAGPSLLVCKADPITFATDRIGEYLVRINANDIATSGAEPRWLLVTLLLPAQRCTPAEAEAIAEQVHDACRAEGIAVIGGHTEVTHGLDRPIAAGALIGEVAREDLVIPQGAGPGDRLLLTKGVPIEATCVLASEFPERLRGVLAPEELERARNFLREPGLDVLRDARIARGAGRVTAMHDPTEGGLAAALWELAEASGRGLVVDPGKVPVPELSRRICEAFGLDPLAAIASGALLLAAAPEDGPAIIGALRAAGIACREIGAVAEGPAGVRRPDGSPLARPERDEISRVFEG
ncbi:MAG: AIR synthase family protein [Thiohalorhabdus sp.]